MNKICRKIWDRDLTVRKWADLNGFKVSTVRAYLSGKRGAWNAGKSKKIKDALINQGLMTAEEASEKFSNETKDRVSSWGG